MKQSRSRVLITTAALVTLSASGWAAREPRQTQQPTAETKDAAEIAARRRAYEERQASQHGQPEKGASQGPQGTERALYEQEQAHRLRLGRIARLRTLLRERGDTEKLAKLEQLAAKENLRYQRFTNIQKRKLAPDASARTERKLANGRQRGVDARAAHEAAAERERLERAERQRQKQEGQAPKPTPGLQHPTQQHPESANTPVGGS